MKKVSTAEVLKIIIKHIRSENTESYIYINELLKDLERLRKQEGIYGTERKDAKAGD